MSLIAVNEADFTISLEITTDEHGAHDVPLMAAVRDALGLPSHVEPVGTSGLAIEPIRLNDAQPLKAIARINGATSKTFNGIKVAYISYSFVLMRGDKPVRWSIDLDDEPRSYGGPSVLYLRDAGQPVALTDALRATVKSLAPKKTRAKKTP